MHVIRDESCLQGLEDPDLLDLIRQRIEEAAANADHFSDLVTIVTVEPGDRVEQVASALGFSPLINRFDGAPYGTPAFTPSWDVLEEHIGYFELVYVLSDDGSGVTLFVSKAEGTESTLQNPQNPHEC
jgi:hypothetical protein